MTADVDPQAAAGIPGDGGQAPDSRQPPREPLEGVKGAPDRLPPESALFDAVEAAFVRTLRLAGYERIRTPVFEPTEVFVRGVGGSTDIVEKEMYTFQDKGGRSLTLRPEGTAAVMRAALEHHLPKQGNLPAKLLYSGAFYRHERPQAGRQREFTQVGAEALGSEDPLLDAEVIILGWDALAAVDAPEVGLTVNTMGHLGPECRLAYLDRLRDFLDEVSGQLCQDCARRRHTNPLRVLDCKNPACQAVLVAAPLLPDHVCDDCREHHRLVLTALDRVGIPHRQDPRLVRGLDYYTRTAFEYHSGVLGAQSALGGGGRYDGLAEELGGDRFPGVGLALGVDRTLLALQIAGVGPLPPPRAQVVVVAVGDAARLAGLDLATEARRAGIACDMVFDGRGFKAGMRQADRAGASIALILGEREVARGAVTVRDLSSGEQHEVPRDRMLDAVAEVIP